MAAIMVIAALVARYSGFYRRDLAHTGNRDLALDGLRGMAALVVVAHHASLFRTSLSDGEWGNAHSHFLQALGPGGVVVFFMLTGCLFWGKARAAGGRFNVWKLWRGRVFRIAPLYLFAVACVFTVGLFRYGPHIFALSNLKLLSRFATLGVGKWPLIGTSNLEEIDAVIWTLWFEWRFYLVLPFIAGFAVGRRTYGLALAVCVAVVTALCFGAYFKTQLWLVFILGMLCPVMLHDQHLRAKMRQPAVAVVALVFALAVWLLNGRSDGYLAVAGALFPLFAIVAAGNSLLGFLTHPALRCLGTISYSLYLLHCIVFYVLIFVFRQMGMLDWLQVYFWPVIIITAAGIAGLCSLTYRWIEFPFLAKGRPMDKIPSP